MKSCTAFIILFLALMFVMYMALLSPPKITYDYYYKGYYLQDHQWFGTEVYMNSDSSFYKVRGPFGKNAIHSKADAQILLEKYKQWRKAGHN